MGTACSWVHFKNKEQLVIFFFSLLPLPPSEFVVLPQRVRTLSNLVWIYLELYFKAPNWMPGDGGKGKRVCFSWDADAQQ